MRCPVLNVLFERKTEKWRGRVGVVDQTNKLSHPIFFYLLFPHRLIVLPSIRVYKT